MLLSQGGDSVQVDDISFFYRALPIRAGLSVPNLVPYDKFCPTMNIKKAIEYIRALARMDLGRLKHADKKSLKQ